MDEEDEENLNSAICTKDVYDLAADIASEFEKLAAECGHESLHQLVIKVVAVLEHLDTSVSKLQVAKDYVTKLRQQISQLQINKLANAENKIKLEQDLVDAEESWIAEIKDLKCNLARMQEENKHLQSLLKEQMFSQQAKEMTDLHLVQELQDIVTALNSRLKEKDALVDKHISDIELLKSSLEQRDQVNQLLHAQVSESHVQVEALWQDKADLKMKILKQEELLEAVQHQLMDSMIHSSSYGQGSTSGGQPFSSECTEEMLHEVSLSFYQNEREALLTRIEDLEQKLVLAEKEINEYKKNSECNKIHPVQSISSKSSAIRQLFRFFLGVVARETENFRS